MPEIVRNIDEIAAERGEPVLMLGFGEIFSLDTPNRAKRQETINRLDAAGVTWVSCGPPSNSGWLSYLGHLALNVSYKPGEPAYEAVRRMFETEAGDLLDPEIKLLLYVESGR